jgi:hypothetical protein
VSFAHSFFPSRNGSQKYMIAAVAVCSSCVIDGSRKYLKPGIIDRERIIGIDAVADREESQLPALGWLEQTRRGVFERHTLAMGSPRHTTLDVGDIDADGDVDLVVGVMSPDSKERRWVDVWKNQRKQPKR